MPKCLVAMLTLFLFPACGISSGPSLTKGSSTTATPPPHLNFANGQNAYTVIGQSNFTNNATGLSQNGITGPNDMFVGPNGVLLVADSTNRRVLGFNSVPATPGPLADFVIGQTGYIAAVTGSPPTGFAQPSSISYGAGQYFILDTGSTTISVYNSAPSATNNTADFTVGNNAGNSNCTSANAAGSANFMHASSTRLYVADYGCNRVLIYNLPITMNSPAATFVLGSTTLTSSGSGAATRATFNPAAVWSDDKKIAIVDSNNNRVLLWNSFPTTFGAPADLVLGQIDFTSNATHYGTETASVFSSNPNMVAIYNNQLFVDDYYANRILIWNSWPTTNGQAADAVLGQTTFTGDASGTTQSTLMYPNSISVSDPYLFVADGGNNRVLVFKAQ